MGKTYIQDLRAGRPKIIRPCRWCKEKFAAAEMLRHCPQCPQRPKKFRPWRLTECRFCGTEMSIRLYQHHLRNECLNPPSIQPVDRICTQCQLPKPESEFVKQNGKRTAVNSYKCSACAMKEANKWYAIPENRERRVYSLTSRKFGVDEETYARMLSEQENACAICGKMPKSRHKKLAKLHVDHCHKTGKTRGLLCFRCNHAIGSMDDDIIRLQSAIEYLQRHSVKE